MKAGIVAIACQASMVLAAPWHGKSTSTTSHHTSTTSSYPEATYCSKGQNLHKYSLDINFDNVTTVPATADNTIPTGYDYLYFEAFTAANVLTPGVLPGPIPHSLPNFAATGLVNELLFGNPAISTIYTGSIAKAFDFNSFYFSCSVVSVEAETSVPTPCIISFSGYQGSDNSLNGANQICSGSVTFEPSTLTGAVQQAFSGQVSKCQNIQFVIFTIAGTGASIGTGTVLSAQLDDIAANVYTCS